MTDVGLGERRERDRRRRFWNILGALVGSGAIVDAIAGLLMARTNDGEQLVAIAPWQAWTLAILANAGFLYGCWTFYKSIDEVELADNLWGSTAGFYAYAILYMTWTGLDIANAVPPPNHGAIFILSLVSATAAYLWRKWSAR